MKKALITGITGQDGSYLAEFLLSKGYEVHGIIRRASTFNTGRLTNIYVDPHQKGARLFLHYGDLSAFEQIANIIQNVGPSEVYHLGAQSHVKVSFDMPEYTGDITGLGTTRILEELRISHKPIKFYQASSSEMFGDAPPPQSERTPLTPLSPYAAAKVYAFWMTRSYRQSFGTFATNGILFNHESPRRGETFVTRKITMAAAHIIAGRQKEVFLGNLDAKRDWGFAPEYVELMWKMLQQEKPGDYVVGTGETRTVRHFLNAAFRYAGLSIKKHVHIDKKYFRPNEVNYLLADPRKARKELGWAPRITVDDLAKIMVDSDMRLIGLKPIGEGDRILRKKFPEKWWKGD